MAKFTDRSLKAMVVPPGRKDVLVFDDECRGLGVRVTVRGTKAFLVQWTDPVTKRKVREPIGVWGSITIEHARTAARAKLGEVAKGGNPAAERRRRKVEAEAERADAALTFGVLIEQWAKRHLVNRSANYRKEAPRALRYAFGDFMDRPASRLTKADVMKVVDRIADAGRRGMLRATNMYGRACFEWGGRRGIVSHNPFMDLPVATPSTERERVLSPSELAEVWAAAGTLPYPFGPFYLLVILTLQRRGEVAEMRWSELSADRSSWTIPAARMKNGRAHDAHLALVARRILESLPRLEGCDLVFTSSGKVPIGDFSHAKSRIDEAIRIARAEAAPNPDPMATWRLHDVRRTGVSHLAGMGFDSIVVDKLLAHRPGKLKGVASVYQRHDFAAERARALDAWADHVVGTRPTGNVVALAGRKRG